MTDPASALIVSNIAHPQKEINVASVLDQFAQHKEDASLFAYKW